MESKSRRNIITKSAQIASLLAAGTYLNLVESKTGKKSIIVETRIYPNDSPATHFTSVEDFWSAYQPSSAFQKLQSWVARSPFFAKRLSKDICPETGYPIYRNQYSSLESYQSHMDLIAAVEPYAAEALGVNQFRYQNRKFYAEDTIIS